MMIDLGIIFWLGLGVSIGYIAGYYFRNMYERNKKDVSKSLSKRKNKGRW